MANRVLTKINSLFNYSWINYILLKRKSFVTQPNILLFISISLFDRQRTVQDRNVSWQNSSVGIFHNEYKTMIESEKISNNQLPLIEIAWHIYIYIYIYSLLF